MNQVGDDLTPFDLEIRAEETRVTMVVYEIAYLGRTVMAEVAC
jgi:hypothetical protein